ncbi:ATP-binding cassette domain-containing protein [Paenibacillus agaridevorans]|uniref:ATP-binding cassette domain-containing protein n=1 Tax=Paenibacillus agaridevorans TaxID=171404 RepID=UPI001BE41F00|nr:ATP-binding cassette domain-containing protein [Paenibacillus agaridevorans]
MTDNWTFRRVSVLADDHATPLLHDADVEFHAGQITLVIGANGAGKSTLLETIAGLRKPASGDIRLGGQALWLSKRRQPLNREVLLRFGIAMQQSESQWFASNVREELFYSLKPYGDYEDSEKERRIYAALEAAGLAPDLLERDPWTLSGGQQRRLALACLLACEPDWLLLDEPTAGLDTGGRAILCELLRTYRSQGRGVIIVTHDLDTFLPLADDVLVVEGGTVRDATSNERTMRESPRDMALRLTNGKLEGNAPQRTKSDVRKTVQEAAAGNQRTRPAWQRPHTFDPRAVVFAYLLMSTILLLQDSLLQLTLSAIVVAAAVAPFWPLFRHWLPVIRGYAILSAVLILIGGLSFEPFSLEWGRVETTATRLLQLMFVMVLGMPILGLMTPLRLQRALDQTFGWLSKLKVPVGSLTLLVTLIFRFIPLLMREWGRFGKLARARGKETTASGGIPAKRIHRMLMPYLRAMLRLAEEMSGALEARGFDRPRGNPVYGFKLKPGRADAWLLAAAIGCCSILYFVGGLL